MCKISIDKRKCVNCENNHSIWSFQYKIKIIEKYKISNIWRTKSILHSINFKYIQQTTFNELDVDAQQTFNDEEVMSSTSFYCFSIKKVLIQKKNNDFEKHYAFKNEKLFNKWNNRQTNVVTKFKTQHVVVFASAKRQRNVNVQQLNEQRVRCFEKSLKYANDSKDSAEHANADIDSILDCF
jgi:hypothetical protein